MRMTLLIHVVAGALGPIAGYLPLWASKGAPLHRRAGMVFVYTMLTMCTFGFVVAAGYGMAPAMNVPAALVTAYLVATGLIAVRPSEPRRRWLDVILMLRSEEHTSELQSRLHLVCRLLLEKKKKIKNQTDNPEIARVSCRCHRRRVAVL